MSVYRAESKSEIWGLTEGSVDGDALHTGTFLVSVDFGVWAGHVCRCREVKFWS